MPICWQKYLKLFSLKLDLTLVHQFARKVLLVYFSMFSILTESTKDEIIQGLLNNFLLVFLNKIKIVIVSNYLDCKIIITSHKWVLVVLQNKNVCFSPLLQNINISSTRSRALQLKLYFRQEKGEMKTRKQFYSLYNFFKDPRPFKFKRNFPKSFVSAKQNNFRIYSLWRSHESD